MAWLVQPLPILIVHGALRRVSVGCVGTLHMRRCLLALTPYFQHGSIMNKQTRNFLGAMVVALICSANANSVELGATAPNCRLSSLDGELIKDLRQFQGEVVYVDFWASWCGPCAQSFEYMNRLTEDLSGRGLRVVAVNLDESPEDAKEFLKSHPHKFTVLSDAGGQCAQEFGVKAMPSSYLIDGQGIVREVHLGFRPDEAKQFRAQVERLLASQTAAR